MDDHPSRFVDDQHLGILENDVEVHGLGPDSGGTSGGHRHTETLAFRHEHSGLDALLGLEKGLDLVLFEEGLDTAAGKGGHLLAKE
jgi:hypothetical protein